MPKTSAILQKQLIKHHNIVLQEAASYDHWSSFRNKRSSLDSVGAAASNAQRS